MKKSIPVLISAVSIIVAIGGISFGMKATTQKKAAETEVRNLRRQLTERIDPEPQATTNSEPVVAFHDEPAETNDVLFLQTLLAERDAELENLRSEKQERPPRESWEDRMARMKEEEPEEYAAMIQRREERRQEMRYNLAERTATFMDLDTSMMTEEERTNHELLVTKMANVWAMTEQFQDPEATPDREAMRELFQAAQEVRPLMREERTVMFKQLGSELGFEGEDAEVFSSHVEDIIGATTLQMPRGGRGGGRGGR